MDRVRLIAAIFGAVALFSAAVVASGIRMQLSLAGFAVACAGIALWRTLTGEVREEYQEAVRPRKEVVQGFEVGWRANPPAPRPEPQDGEMRVWTPGQELQELIDEAEKEKEERPAKAAEPPSFSLGPTDETVNLRAATVVPPVGEVKTEVRSLEDIKRLLDLDAKMLGIVSRDDSSSESVTPPVHTTENSEGTNVGPDWMPGFDKNEVPYEPVSGPLSLRERLANSRLGRLFN